MTHHLPEPGQRIRLIEMPNDPCPVEAGTLGTVTGINKDPFHGRHQISVKWDNGRSLMLVFGVDKFEVVTTHRVVAIEDTVYSRYEALIEAATPDDAAGIMRERIVNGAIGMQQGMCSRDDALPYVTDVINHEGDECAFGEEHGHDGVVVPDLLKARDACDDAIKIIDDFAVKCIRDERTDSGEVWEVLNQLRGLLFAPLPKHFQELATQYLADLACKGEHEDAEEADHAQHAMTVSA
ncbi:DUF4314 domain-containing protein [Methylorubrum extorquens]|uniref:DUF4314 domain-containing protein n=1 Tax=Methylorubrum extorquens TaxID=408 RepID=UPI00209E8363|nr:DUF4314 domain-containing protein [Methylorubrum extorquens]MCP1540114.1 hypothetical protein [Methylorubrum extorquens]